MIQVEMKIKYQLNERNTDSDGRRRFRLLGRAFPFGIRAAVLKRVY